MANDVSTNPIILDTPGSASALAWKGNLKIENIELQGYAADTDTAVVKNAAGKVIATLNGAVDLQPVRTGKIGWVQGGLYLDSLVAGKVVIYIA